jgi:hypothetical protein
VALPDRTGERLYVPLQPCGEIRAHAAFSWCTHPTAKWRARV